MMKYERRSLYVVIMDIVSMCLSAAYSFPPSLPHQDLARRWESMKKSKRVVIHIPSMGHNQKIRQSMDELGILQNLQMARLCDIKGKQRNELLLNPVWDYGNKISRC